MPTSALLLTMLNVSIIGCPMSRDILPCTCKLDKGSHLKTVTCSGMESFAKVQDALGGHFSPTDRVSLKVLESKIQNLPYRAFKDLNMTIENLQLNHDVLGNLEPLSFEGLTNVNYLSLADNYLGNVPEHLWKYIPNVKTLDLGRTKIQNLKESNFKDLKYLDSLVVPGCSITEMEQNSIPSRVQRLHIGRNQVTTLNGTLRALSNLAWLFINANHLTDLEDELPPNAQNLKMIHASNNNLTKLPSTLLTLPSLETLFFQGNKIQSLDGYLSKARKLQRLYLDNNLIETLDEEEFKEAESLVHLLLGFNRLKSLNNSLLYLRNLQFLNVTMNLFEEFSFQEIIGLERLSAIDLSFNQISSIKGPPSNLVEWNIKIADLKLDHNEITSLNGSLSGLRELLRLNLSFNKLRKISPDDLIGMDQLSVLDLSYNQLTTLEEMSQTYLPKLEELRASHNLLTILEKDFQGLPVLCHADMSNNQIIALGRDLVSKTRCKLGSGTSEGTWDTLKIFLQDNPILCDSALPEISSTMEINHTRIYGVSHCAPLSEQPVTSKPNGFFGYIPDTNQSAPSASSTVPNERTITQIANMNIRNNSENLFSSLDGTGQNLNEGGRTLQYINTNPQPQVQQVFPLIPPNLPNQTLVITQLASDVASLKNKVAKLETHMNMNGLTEKPFIEELEENRKP